MYIFEPTTPTPKDRVTRGRYTLSKLELAVKYVIRDGWSCYKAAEVTGIPRTTIQRRVQIIRSEQKRRLSNGKDRSTRKRPFSEVEPSTSEEIFWEIPQEMVIEDELEESFIECGEVFFEMDDGMYLMDRDCLNAAEQGMDSVENLAAQQLRTPADFDDREGNRRDFTRTDFDVHTEHAYSQRQESDDVVDKRQRGKYYKRLIVNAQTGNHSKSGQ
ncbi:unnamed protein product, partial [Mesorhabditis belari]|uniref:HTH psq-type domain-containing protein n=1 Tax=Mesorhabditis belari TaxID=2138241 RepID=A0AAF3J9L0_9BILA